MIEIALLLINLGTLIALIFTIYFTNKNHDNTINKMLIVDFFDKIMDHNKMFLNIDYPFKPLNKVYQKWEIAERVYTFNHLNLLFYVFINKKTIDKNILMSFINATRQFHKYLVEDIEKIKRYKDLLIIEKHYSLEFITWLQEINKNNTPVKKMYDDIIKKLDL